MIVLGLTGSIGMGKSTAVRYLRRRRIPIFDADAEIARLMAPGGAGVAAVASLRPDAELVGADGGIDRAVLRGLAFSDPSLFPRLEAILHPLAAKARERFLRRHRRAGTKIVVLDIPLLFEFRDRLDALDAVLVMTAPARLQRRRVLARPGMDETRFKTILARQVPDRLKRRMADHVVTSALGRAFTNRALSRILRGLRQPGRHHA